MTHTYIGAAGLLFNTIALPPYSAGIGPQVLFLLTREDRALPCKLAPPLGAGKLDQVMSVNRFILAAVNKSLGRTMSQWSLLKDCKLFSPLPSLLHYNHPLNLPPTPSYLLIIDSSPLPPYLLIAHSWIKVSRSLPIDVTFEWKTSLARQPSNPFLPI